MKFILMLIVAIVLLLNGFDAQDQTDQRGKFLLYMYPAPLNLKIPELGINLDNPGEKVGISKIPVGIHSITIIADENTRNPDIEISKDSIFAFGYDFKTKKANDFLNLFNGCQLTDALANVMSKFMDSGFNEFREWVFRNLRYPQEMQKNSVQGVVYVQYTVNCEGDVVDVIVVQGVHPILDAEGVRVVKSSPKWSPGLLRNKPVNMLYNFPIAFILQ